MQNILNVINLVTAKFETFILGTGILLMMINSTLNAIGRSFLDRSIFFSEELNQFLIVWITFLGFTYAIRKGRNIRMTALYDIFSFRLKKVLTTLITISTSIMMFYLSYQAYFYVLGLHEINRLSSALQFPTYIVYAIIPIGLVMAGIQYFITFIMNLSHHDIYVSFDIVEKPNDAHLTENNRV